MLEVVQDAEEKNVVEGTESRFRKLVKIEDTVVHARAELAVDFEEVGDLDAIDGRYFGAAAFRLEAEPTIPRTGIEHALAPKRCRDRILPPAPL